jgi:hypothetical protein
VRRNLAAAAVLAGVTGIASAAIGSAASISVSSQHLTSFSASGPTGTPPPTDTTAPTAVLSVFDDDLDGKLDRITADFDEALGSTCTATAWTVTHGDITPALTVSGPDANHIVTLTWDDTALPVDTTNATIKVSLTSGPGGYCDAATNQATITYSAPADKAAPALVSMLMRDVRVDGTTGNVRGRVDQVDLTFSEDLLAYSAGTTGWTLTNTPSNGSLASVARDATNVRLVRLTLTEGGDALDTAVRTFRVQLAQTANGVRDAADNRTGFAATAPADGAGPVPVSLTITDPNTPNRGLESNDRIAVVFSERLKVASVCSAWTTGDAASQAVDGDNQLRARLTDGAGSDPDTLTLEAGTATPTACATLRFGSLKVDKAYISSGSQTFMGTLDNSTDLSWSPGVDAAGGAATLQLELGTGSTTPVPGLAGLADAQYIATGSGITDAAGNAAAGSVSGASAF